MTARNAASSDSNEEHELLKQAVWDRTQGDGTLRGLEEKYDVKLWRLRKAYKSYLSHNYESQPESYQDVRFALSPTGRPTKIPETHEILLAQAVRHYEDNNKPLTIKGVVDLVQNYIELLPEETQEEFKLKKTTYQCHG